MKNILSFLSKTANENAEEPDTGVIDSEDDASISVKLEQMLEHMDSMLADVSDEIDDDYKHDVVAPTPQAPSKPNRLPDFVKPIHSIASLYSYQSQIGQGISGAVHLAQSKESSKQYALKQMSRSDQMNLCSFINEITN
eukprot:777526_1